MYKKVTNPIAIQSQKHICETMLVLLQQMPFDDITITQLCQEASLVRKTFYRNFETKEDVLICMLDYHLLEYLQELPEYVWDTTQFLTHFFTFWKGKYDYLKTLQENNLFYLLNRLYLHYLEELSSLLTQSNLEWFSDRNNYPIVFYYGGLCNLMAYWISRECQDSLDQILALVLER